MAYSLLNGVASEDTMTVGLRALAAGFVFMLILGCARTPAAAGAGDDITQAGSGLTLGSGWYTREVSDGRTFHWANNDAAIVIHNPQSDLEKVSIEIQGGPGLQHAQDFGLHLRDASNRDIAFVHVPGTQTVRFDIPVRHGRDETVKLHVDGGGKKVPKDPRTLNFRVFSIATAFADEKLAPGHPDIAAAPIHIGKNWYGLEMFKGDTFRWVNNDAEFTIDAKKSEQRRIKIVAEAGPAVKNPAKWTLSLEDSSGKVLQTTSIVARRVAYLSVPLQVGTNAFRLHVDGTGIKAPGDSRTLSFRVFTMALQ